MRNHFDNQLKQLNEKLTQMGAMCENVISMAAKCLEENHPDYITSLNNLGAFYSNMGNYEQAKKYYQKAASICYSDTVNKPLKILVLNNLGELYLVLGDEINRLHGT